MGVVPVNRHAADAAELDISGMAADGTVRPRTSTAELVANQKLSVTVGCRRDICGLGSPLCSSKRSRPLADNRYSPSLVPIQTAPSRCNRQTARNEAAHRIAKFRKRHDDGFGQPVEPVLRTRPDVPSRSA